MLARAWPERTRNEARASSVRARASSISQASVISNNRDQFDRYSRLSFTVEVNQNTKAKLQEPVRSFLGWFGPGVWDGSANANNYDRSVVFAAGGVGCDYRSLAAVLGSGLTIRMSHTDRR